MLYPTGSLGWPQGWWDGTHSILNAFSNHIRITDKARVTKVHKECNRVEQAILPNSAFRLKSQEGGLRGRSSQLFPLPSSARYAWKMNSLWELCGGQTPYFRLGAQAPWSAACGGNLCVIQDKWTEAQRRWWRTRPQAGSRERKSRGIGIQKGPAVPRAVLCGLPSACASSYV